MSTATHPVGPEEVMALLDGELSADRARSVSTHVTECADCGQTANFFGNTSGRLAKWTVPTVPAWLREDLLKKSINSNDVRAAGLVFAWRSLLNRRAALAWGGAVFVVLLVFFGSHNRATRVTTYAHRLEPQEYDKSVPPPPASAPMGHVSRGDNTLPLAEMGRNQVSLALPEPMIARSVSLSVVVKEFEAGRVSLDAVLAHHNGYAASLNVSTPEGSARTLEASLRIPAPQVEAALRELKSLGRVARETQNGEEVTEQHADLVARLKNSRETEQRLQEVLRTRTGKVKDVLEVEEEIARVRGEIEQMEAEQKTLEHRVEFATVDLKLVEEYKAQLGTPAPSVLMQLRNATIDGFRNALGSLLALVLLVAESGPSALLWLALLGIPAWRLWRRYRRAQSIGSLAGT